MNEWSLPKPGTVLWCRFPYSGQRRREKHPVLVLHAGVGSDGKKWVMIAAGISSNKTGHWEKRPNEREFLLQRPEHLKKAGLHHPTKFMFRPLVQSPNGTMLEGTVLTLPYGYPFFVGHDNLAPVAGKIEFETDTQLREAFTMAAKCADLSSTVQAEKARFEKSPRLTFKPFIL